MVLPATEFRVFIFADQKMEELHRRTIICKNKLWVLAHENPFTQEYQFKET